MTVPKRAALEPGDDDTPIAAFPPIVDPVLPRPVLPQPTHAPLESPVVARPVIPPSASSLTAPPVTRPVIPEPIPPATRPAAATPTPSPLTRPVIPAPTHAAAAPTPVPAASTPARMLAPAPAATPSVPLTPDAQSALMADASLDDDDEPESHHHPLRALLVLLVALAVVLTGAYFGYSKGLELVNQWRAPAADYPGPGETAVNVTIASGASPSQMAQVLYNADVVASAGAFTKAVGNDQASFSAIQAGVHALKTKMSASQALTALADPSTLVNMQFMVSDGQRAAAIVAQISQKTGVPVPDLQAALANPAALGLPAWAQLNGEGEDGNAIQGYLFPETYSYDESPTAQKVLKPLVAQFVKVTDGLDFAAKAQAHGLRPDQAVVLASIVEKEGATSQYAATIAQVFYNRINAGMPLQSDATVLYANNVTGSLTTTDEQRNLNSVYNTYVAPGLPPGPICNPGKIALDAAVNPTAGDYLYFVVTNPATGEVKFASNAADHAKNVAEFQAWCQANPGKC